MLGSQPSLSSPLFHRWRFAASLDLIIYTHTHAPICTLSRYAPRPDSDGQSSGKSSDRHGTRRPIFHLQWRIWHELPARRGESRQAGFMRRAQGRAASAAGYHLPLVAGTKLIWIVESRAFWRLSLRRNVCTAPWPKRIADQACWCCCYDNFINRDRGSRRS